MREQFPIFDNSDLVYLDNAATTQKPRCVLEACRMVEKENGNVHRSPHQWGRACTRAYEKARQEVLAFFGADERYTAVFTSGATASINLVASSHLLSLPEGRDEVLVPLAEHHSNFVCWQQWCRRLGLSFRVLPLTGEGAVDMDAYRRALGPRTALVACASLTNVFGTLQPVEQMCTPAHRAGALFLVDAAQGAGHLPMDLAKEDYDFVAISGHKLYGPTGIGALVAKKQILDAMDPWQYGGEMVVAKVDIDDEPQLAAAERIEVIPTLVLYRDGEAIGSIVAPGSKAMIDAFIRESLAK